MERRQITITQHFAPRSLLALFTDTGKSDGLMYITEKETGKVRQGTPDSVGFENYFYTHTGGQPDAVEHAYLKEIDREGIAIVKDIIARRSADAVNRFDLCKYIVRLIVGGLTIKNMIADNVPNMYRNLMDMVNKGEINESNYEQYKARVRIQLPESFTDFAPWIETHFGKSYSPQDIFSNFVAGTMDNDGLVVLRMMLNWSLVFAPDDCEFITSDNPIVGDYFPLCPTIALIGKPKVLDPPLYADKQWVIGVNDTMRKNANMFIFSHSPLVPE